MDDADMDDADVDDADADKMHTARWDQSAPTKPRKSVKRMKTASHIDVAAVHSASGGCFAQPCGLLRSEITRSSQPGSICGTEESKRSV